MDNISDPPDLLIMICPNSLYFGANVSLRRSIFQSQFITANREIRKRKEKNCHKTEPTNPNPGRWSKGISWSNGTENC